MGLLWREYPRRKPVLKRPRGRVLGAWQGMGKMHIQMFKTL